jgi:hypothetical protein
MTDWQSRYSRTQAIFCPRVVSSDRVQGQNIYKAVMIVKIDCNQQTEILSQHSLMSCRALKYGQGYACADEAHERMKVREMVITVCFHNVLPQTTLQLNCIITREPGYWRSGWGGPMTTARMSPE